MEKHSQKKLHVTYPWINSYPGYANVIAIIGDDENVKPWILGNFIQLYCPEDHRDPFFYVDYLMPSFNYTCPWLSTQRISRAFIKEYWNNHLVPFLRSAIDLQCYPHFIVNHAYLSCSTNYLREDFIHDIFLYGYDDDAGIFYVGDNFGSKYKFDRCTYSEIQNAYTEVLSEQDWIDGVFLYHKKNPSHRLDSKLVGFHPGKVRHLLMDYVQATEEKYHNRSGRQVYGVETYSKISQYLFENQDFNWDSRPLYAMWEHKKIMNLRLEYMIREGELNASAILPRFFEIERMALITLNLFIKSSLAEKDCSKAISANLKAMRDMEVEAVVSIIKEIAAD